MSEQPIIRLSASSINELNCHHRFWVTRVQGVWPSMRPQTPAQMWGKAAHKVLQQVFDPRKGTPPHLDRFDAYVRFAFLSQPYRDEDIRQHDILRAKRLLCAYISQDEDAEYTIAVECDQAYRIKFDGLVFEVSARLDRLLVRPHQPDTLVIRDYKFGGQALTLDQVWCNLATAKKMYPEFKHVLLEADSLSDTLLEEGRIERVVYHSRDFRGMVGIVADRIKAFLADAEHTPTQYGACTFCPEKDHCGAVETVDGEDLDF